jgi:hypothetical protein
MEVDEKPEYLALRKELEEVREKIEATLVAIRESAVDYKGMHRGDMLREFRRQEREIILMIRGITKDEKV